MDSLIVHVPKAIAWSLGALTTYFFLLALYNIFLHPLRHYPGPLLHRASPLPRALLALRGHWTRDILTLADTYGPVVRVAPNVLQYTAPAAWKDIYSHANGALNKGEEFGKDPRIYRTRGVAPNLLAETRENHGLLRRQLSHGFSEKVLREQEAVVRGYVDLLIRRLRERAEGRAAVVVGGEDGEAATRKDEEGRMVFDMKLWFNFITFDVIGDLAFGEPFGCLEKAQLDERVKFFEASLKASTAAFFVKEIGLEAVMQVFMKRMMAARRDLIAKMTATLKRRISLGERSDLIEGLLKKRDVWNLDLERIRANATLLVIAGSETTATILTGLIYLLLTRPTTLAKLQHEIRSSFKSEDEITFTSVDKLSYMIACIQEGFRLYPPVAGEMDRVVPAGGAMVAGRFVPGGTTVGVAQYALTHARANFSEPFAFKPERFLEPGKFPDDQFEAMQPFSVGPRNCIGKNLAQSEMRTVLARLVWNFDMELVNPDIDWMDQEVFFLWRKHPLEVYLTPVER